MMLNEPKTRIPLSRVTHTIRAAQAVLQYGVGAMIDFPDQTLMTAAPEYWDDKVVFIHDERLEKALRVTKFGMPGGKDEFPEGISYVRFPQWYFCPKCRRFQPIKQWVKEYRKKATARVLSYDEYMKCPKCLQCSQDLVVARIVVACNHGHIDDFPWIKWVHEKNKGGRKEVCGEPKLKFQTGTVSSAGLEGLEIICDTCKAHASLFGAFDKEEGRTAMERLGPSGYRCSGHHPWRGEHETCTEFPRAIQRGATATYFPKIVSSLVIPPYSDRINTKIEQSAEYQKCLIRIDDFDADERDDRIQKRLDEWAKTITLQTAVDFEIVKAVLTRKWLDTPPEEYTTDSEHYRLEEFRALTGELSDYTQSDDFIRESIDISSYGIPGLKSIALIHKVREVRALTGFTRLNPPGSSDLGRNEPNFVAIKKPETTWYPDYEVRGEGIFIEFNRGALAQWLDGNAEAHRRAKQITDNYASTLMSEARGREITPQFLFLHSLAHMLIRQLSFECGYSAASLRERIYSSESETNPMAGILIYTASGDSEGTLGGLVRQGYEDSFPRVFRQAIESGRICSNDPVCISSEGQGRDALNLSACHTCLLLPETSCEEFNIFLDRGVVVGTFEHPEAGFYSAWN